MSASAVARERPSVSFQRLKRMMKDLTVLLEAPLPDVDALQIVQPTHSAVSQTLLSLVLLWEYLCPLAMFQQQ